MRWLGVWHDSKLKFIYYINEKVKRARTAKIQIKELIRTYGLISSLVKRI